MRRFLYFLLLFAAAIAVISCQKQSEADSSGKVYADATFSVVLGEQSKSFDDGSLVDRLHAAVYEYYKASDGTEIFIWVADNSDSPVSIGNKAATVSFPHILELDKAYRIVLLALNEEADIYNIDWKWASLRVDPVGVSNDAARDLFLATYDTGTVTGDIDLSDTPIQLKRPLAQINVLVPSDDLVDPDLTLFSLMTVYSAPTRLDLLTGAVSDPDDWSFTQGEVNEPGFGDYASTHRYLAMNYVLVDQSEDGGCYDIALSAWSDRQSVMNKRIPAVPLKANSRTNLTGNVFSEKVRVSFTVRINPTLEGGNTKFDDGMGDWILYVAAFNTKDGTLLRSSKIGGNGFAPTETLNGTVAKDISLEVDSDGYYKVIFFAERKNKYKVSFLDGNHATFNIIGGIYPDANDADLDAFYAVAEIHYASEIYYNVELKRPFVQMNFFIPKDTFQSIPESITSGMSIANVPVSFDLFSGVPNKSGYEVHYGESLFNKFKESPFGEYSQGYLWMGSNFVIPPYDGNVEKIQFHDNQMGANRSFVVENVSITEGNVRLNYVLDPSCY